MYRLHLSISSPNYLKTYNSEDIEWQNIYCWTDDKHKITHISHKSHKENEKLHIITKFGII